MLAAGRILFPAGDPVVEPRRAPLGEVQPELGSAPQNVLGAVRPFPVDQIVGFGLVQAGAQIRAQIGEAASRPQQGRGPGAIGTGQSPPPGFTPNT